jgi:hypothetical protein
MNKSMTHIKYLFQNLKIHNRDKHDHQTCIGHENEQSYDVMSYFILMLIRLKEVVTNNI